MLIAIPAVLHVLVLLSIPTAADVILRTVGAAPLSPGGRLALANARIVLMLVASLVTIIVGVALASATARMLGRLRDTESAAPGILGSLTVRWVVRPVPSCERDLQPRISVVLTPRFTDRTIRSGRGQID
ncbi:MAG: hypothetical protein Q7J25_08925 [Vicinamibacterales bacterium]|nr:hypothetical protein [Vicinamibacterales bacterium]